MPQRVVVFKKEVNFCLVSRVLEVTSLLLALVRFQAWLSRPQIVILQSLVARARGKERLLRTSVEHLQALVHLESCQKPPTARSEPRPPMVKKRSTETGTTRGGPLHPPRLHPDQCMLCRQVGHRASECASQGKESPSSPGKRAFGLCALGRAVFGATCYGATLEGIEEDRALKDIEHLAVSRSRVWKDTLILTEEPRRLFLDSRVCNQWLTETREPRVRRRMSASRLLVATQRQQVGTSGYHASSSRGALQCRAKRVDTFLSHRSGRDSPAWTGHRPPPQSRQRTRPRNVTCRVQFSRQDTLL